MRASKKKEFINLFQEFLSSYPYTSKGVNHIASYAQQRETARRNFKAITTAADSGEYITDFVLKQLLPHVDSFNNREQGSWVHIAPAISKDVKTKFERIKWTKAEDWERIASAILNFVRTCNNDPKQLLESCKIFSQLPYSKGFQSGMLSPILNALQPDNFLLINQKSISTINYFAETKYSYKLTDYPQLNSIGRKVIAELSDIMHQSGTPALREDDLFDMFSHWLVAEKKYKFTDRKIKDNSGNNESSPIEFMQLQPEYTLADCAEQTGFKQIQLKSWIRAIERKKQAIFYGSPGTGKTFIAEKLAQHLISNGDGFSELVQFHPAYTYEDFIQGIRPQSENGTLTYPLVPGSFKKFCDRAKSRQGICVFIIDEINRANLAQVFGELMYLLEYREREIPLAAGKSLCIPENVRILSTMNTADRSIAEFDYALRRRFAFIEIRPNYDVMRKYHQNTDFHRVDELIKVLQNLNQVIADKNYEIGTSFFLTDRLKEHLEDIWCMEIEPYLEEYFFNQPENVDKFRWDKIQQILSL